MTEKRIPPKPWKPGQSGNPAGRKPGTGRAAKLRAAIEKDLPDIIQTLVLSAKAGDVGAARLLLERVLPPIKATEQPVPVAMAPDASLSDQGRAVVNAASSGALAPGQAAQLLAGLGALVRVIEADEFEQRLRALEVDHDKSKAGPA